MKALGAAVRDRLLTQAYGSGSDLLLLPIQDIFGWPDRVNTPATVGEQNWTWKLPLSVEALATDAEALERADAIASARRRRPGVPSARPRSGHAGSGDERAAAYSIRGCRWIMRVPLFAAPPVLLGLRYAWPPRVDAPEPWRRRDEQFRVILSA